MVERGLSGDDVGGEEGVDEVEGGLVLAASGAEKAGENGEGVRGDSGGERKKPLLGIAVIAGVW